MSTKVICDRAYLCPDKNCEHGEPHVEELWEGTGVDRCTDEDQCGGHTVRCVSIGIDFGIEEYFEI